MTKELSKSFLASNPINMCPKHSGYELTYFNAKEGRKQCLRCIILASAGEGPKEKERLCVKHPGYENSFYCATDQKLCCEKCLVYHKKHKVESIALKAAALREKFDDYKTDFVTLSKQWSSYYSGLKAKKDAIEGEIDKTGRSIEEIFDATIEKLKKRKADTISTFKKKAMETTQDFHVAFKEYETDTKEIQKKGEEMTELNMLFGSGDNMELIAKGMEINIDDLVDNYCSSLQQKFKDYKEGFSEIKSKSNYSFNIVNNFNEEELAEFISKQFVVKIAKSELKEENNQNTQELEDPASVEPKDLNEEQLEKKGDVMLHKFNISNKQLWYYENNEFIVTQLAGLKSPSKNLGKSFSDVEFLAESKSYRDAQGNIYIYEGTEKGTKTIYKFLPDTRGFEVAFELPCLYKKITIADINESIFIGGEPVKLEEESHPSQLMRIDMNTKKLENIDEGLPKLGSFAIMIIKEKYIFAIPLALVNGKIYMADLEGKQPANEVSQEEKKGPELDWKAINLKNPKNYSAQMFAPAWGVELNDDNLMIMSNKGSLIFNWKEEEIKAFSTHKQKDEFNDGIYKDGQNQYIFAYGKQGIHSYSIISNKWSFNPQTPN